MGDLRGKGSQCFAAGFVVFIGTGFGAIIGSVLITFFFSNLIKKKIVSFLVILIEEIK